MDELLTDPLEAIGEGEVPEGEEVPEQDGAEGEQPRSEDGRYASPEDKSPEGQADEATPDETLEVRKEADAGDAVKAEPAPYRYRADAAEHEVPGATVGTDGVLTIPAESVPHVTQLLTSGRSWIESGPRQRAAFQQELKQVQSEVEAKSQTISALIEQSESVVKMTPEERIDWAEGFAQEWPGIKAKAEQAGAEAGRQADQERLKQYERDEYVRELEPQLVEGLWSNMVKAQADDPAFKDLTNEDGKAIHARLMQDWQTNGLIRNADGSAWAGERNPVIDLMLVRQGLKDVADLRLRMNIDEQKVTEAKKANEAEMSESKAPPAVSSQTGPSPGEKPAKQFKPSGKEGSDPTEEVDKWAFGE